MLVLNFAALVIQSHSDWVGPQYSLLGLELASFALAIYLVIKTERAWTVGYAAYQGLTVATHLVIQLEPAGGHTVTRTWAYITGLIVWGYLIWVFLAWGTWSSWKQRSQNRVGDASTGRNPQRPS